jgi:hypothetical protein
MVSLKRQWLDGKMAQPRDVSAWYSLLMAISEENRPKG